MRFEVLDGHRSVASLSLEGSGDLVLRIADPGERDYLMGYFGGEPSLRADGEVLLRGDWTPLAFEIACLALERERGFAVVARTAGPGSHPG